VDSAHIQIVHEHSHDVLALCDLAVLASGTAALEAALFAKPMVVMYKVSRLSVAIFRRSVTVEHFSMPNHLTDPPAVPELIQGDATVENLLVEVSRLLDDERHYQKMQEALAHIAPRLTADSSALACKAIDAMLANRAVR